MNFKNLDFTKVLLRILELLILKPLTIPFNIYKNALFALSNSRSADSEESNLSGEFPLYIWYVSIFDAIIVISYPIGILAAFFAAIQAPYKSFQIFIGILVATYFYPLLFGLFRELAQIALKVLLYLKIISKNSTS
ncbi:hypothetical protein [Croceitalea dokdonensis]|uniref:hypothetical protein n=1 Tax=Croceitalea dokdonensis TaxID=346188 RepID=UPI0006C9EAEA|nr:hypothetical protein [Croceitalea dokdonensis]